MEMRDDRSFDAGGTTLDVASDHTLAVVVARAWNDPDYLARLVARPKDVLADEGYEVAPEIDLRVVVDTPELTHLALTRQTEDVDSVARLLAGRLPLTGDAEIRMLQSSDTIRYLVIPVKPDGLSATVAAELELIDGKADDSTYTETETFTYTVTETDVGVTTTAVAQAEVGAEIVAVVVAVLT